MIDNPVITTIPTETVERAGVLVRQFLLPNALDFFGVLPGSATERLRDIAGWILAKAPQRIAARDLMAGVRSCRGIKTRTLMMQ